MSVSFQSIFNGITARFKSKPYTSSFDAISWLQEKKLKHLDDHSLKTLEITGLKLRYKRPYELLHTYRELFEEEIYKFCAVSTKPLIIDCGANIGLSVLYFKRLYPQSAIIAFEPDEENFKLLEENCKINQLTKVDCRKAAVWINNETLSFTSDGTQGSQIATGSGTNTVAVQAQRLADLLKKEKVDFLKVDIEGAEVDVMLDCAPYFGNIANLFVEYHGKSSDSEKLSTLLNLLKADFSVYIKLAADSIQHPFIEKSTNNSFDVQLNIFCYRP